MHVVDQLIVDEYPLDNTLLEGVCIRPS